MSQYPRNRAFFGAFEVFLLLLLALSGRLAAGALPEPFQVADFAPGSEPVALQPSRPAVVDGRLQFSGFDAQHGFEPWSSDGSVEGTRLLADLCAGRCSTGARAFARLGDRLVVAGAEQVFALSGEGAEQLGGFEQVQPDFVRLGSTVFFSATRGGRHSIFRTDGTPAGTRLASDACAATGCLWEAPFAALGGALYFTSGGWLHRLGEDGGLLPLQPMGWAGNFSAAPGRPLVFRGCQTEAGCRLWASDGTGGGTTAIGGELGRLSDRVQEFLVWGDRVYFFDAASRLVSTDGTSAGTRLEAETLGYEPQLFFAAPGRLFFTARVEAGTTARRLFVLSGGAPRELLASQYGIDLAGGLGDRVLFTYAEAGRYYLGATDGTAGGTARLLEVDGPLQGAALGHFFFFPSRWELWRSDGSAGGTVRLDLGLTQPRSSWPTPYRTGSRLTVGVQANPGNPLAPWRVDPWTLARQPLEAEPRPLELLTGDGELLFARDLELDHRPLVAIRESGTEDLPAASDLAAWRQAEDGHLFFTDYSPGQELWESDGTAAGTRELFDLRPGWQPCGSPLPCHANAPAAIVPSGDRVFFAIPTGYTAVPWVWQRPAGSPRPLGAPAFGSPVAAAAEGRAILVADDPPALWLSDGTAAGSRPILPLAEGSWPTFSQQLGSRFLVVIQAPDGDRLWSIELDGGDASLLVDSGSRFRGLTAAGASVFFSDDAGLGVSDGTAAGTRRLPEAPRFVEHSLGLPDGRLVFGAKGDAAGEELWIADGTPEGTFRLTDLAPGVESSSPSDFLQVGGRLFFQADDAASGRELWALDLPPSPPCLAPRTCLAGDRFDVSVVASTAAGRFPGRLASAGGDSLVFSFFSSDNWEMLVKVLDGCAINGKRWVFAAAATDVAWTLSVADRATGERKVYRNEPGERSRAVTDTEAFACP